MEIFRTAHQEPKCIKICGTESRSIQKIIKLTIIFKPN